MVKPFSIEEVLARVGVQLWAPARRDGTPRPERWYRYVGDTVSQTYRKYRTYPPEHPHCRLQLRPSWDWIREPWED